MNLERNMRRETCGEKEQKPEDRGGNPKKEIPFAIDVKGGEIRTMSWTLGGAMVTRGA
jgi:hypothetical protein